MKTVKNLKQELEMIRLALPWMLLLYIPFVGLIVYALKKKKPTIRIPSWRPFKEANPGGNFHIITGLPFFLYSLATAILIFALARPQKGIERLKQKAEGIDIMLAIDLSGSMEAFDIPPDKGYKYHRDVFKAVKEKSLKPRIDVAKDEIRKFIEKRPNDRIGLIAFAPLPYVACPPTLDHAWLEQHLNNLQAGIIGDATGIAGPIASAVTRLKDSDSKRKVLVLFTDGSNNVDARVTPRQAAKLAKTFDVIIYTVGIGSRNAYIIQKGFFGADELRPFNSQFDEKLLRDIAKTSEGKYFTASDSKGLEEVMKEIDKLEKTTKEQPRYVDYSEYGTKMLSIALGMILLAFILQHTIMMKVP
jgi:Ca-activated chloride channel family protein